MRERLMLLVAVWAAAALPNVPAAASGDAAPRYLTLDVLSPRNGETIHDNAGKLAVRVALLPPLSVRHGHTLQLLLDGRLLPGRWTASPITLQGIDRGTHQLEVVVSDSAGKALARSGAVRFHMWQASRLFRERSPPPPAPDSKPGAPGGA